MRRHQCDPKRCFCASYPAAGAAKKKALALDAARLTRRGSQSGAPTDQPASSRTTVSTRSTSARVVRKFVMQARSAKRPSTVAFDR